MSDFNDNRRKMIHRLATVLPILLILISLACTMPTIRTPTVAPTSAVPSPTSPPPQPTPTRRALPPALVESTPPPGTEIPLNSLITLFFNQPMDRASVEAALKAHAFLINNLVWTDDKTVTINPGQELPPSTNLSIQLDTQARAANGLELREPISLTYQTVGYLDLAQRLPEPGAKDVNPASAVVAAFDHPVVPLGADPTSLPNPLKLDPAADGHGEWVNTSTFIFYPDPALSGGQAYNITIDPTLHGIDGNPLNTQEAWTFTTAMPQVETVAHDGGDQPSGLEGPLTFTFNQAMDPDSVQANFQILDPNGSPVPGEFEWNQTNTEFTWKPTAILQRDTLYEYTLDSQAKALGGTSLGKTYQDSFRTVPTLGVISTFPSEGGVIDFSGIKIQFSGPIQAARPADFITVEPRLPGFNAYYSLADRTLFISGFFEPSTNYTLTISPELSDPWGGKLGGENSEPFTLNFRTAPLQPGVVIGNGSGNYFLTPHDNFLSAQVSGIRNLPVSIGALPLDEFLKMLGDNGNDYRNNYRLPDPQKWNQLIGGNPDRTHSTEIPLNRNQKPLSPGLYFMVLSIPGQASSNQANVSVASKAHLAIKIDDDALVRAADPQRDQSIAGAPTAFYGGGGGGQRDPTAVILVSDKHLTLKIGATDALVWAVDLQSGAPVANAPVTLYSGDQVLASGQTDAQGIFTATFPARKNPYNPALAVIGQPGDPNFAAGLSTWNDQINPWNFNLPTDYSGPRQEVYLYTDRPIYRPGQTVYFRGVLREAFNGRYTIPQTKNLTVAFNDDTGQLITSQNLPVSTYGTIHGQFDLPGDLRPATYSITIPGSDYGYSYISVPVADYRKPEINLTAAFPKTEVLAGQPLNASVNTRYFFDAPAGNVPLTWTLYSYPDSFDLPDYQTGLQGVDQWFDYSRPYGQMVASGDAITSADGTATLDLGAANQDPTRRRYELEVTAQDESGLPVSTRTSLSVNPAEYYIGVQPNSWSGRAGEPLGFDIQVAKWDSSSAGEQSLRAEFSSVSWEPDLNAPIDPTFGTTAYKPVYTQIASTDLRTGTDGKARLEFTPPEPGIYQLNVYSAVSVAPRTEIVQWVGGPGQFILPETGNRHIELNLDRASYKPGDTARLFIPNPFQTAAQALVTVERGTILDHQLLTLQPGGITLDLPLTADDAPNVYISVTLLANQQSAVKNQKSSITDFRQGYINLPVEPLEQTLNVQITRSPEKTGPGGKVDFEIQVTDSTGQPVQGEFSLAVADLAALALADPNSVEIIPHYYSEQPLGVQTGMPLTAYAARPYEQSMVGGRGGGGGAGEIPQVREKFPDTAFWQADIVTGPDGKATLSLTLPDSLTTWQVETRGLTADTRVGQAQTKVVTTKDVLIRPVTPRFLTAGDHVELAAVVQNNTDQPFIGQASIQADGLSLDDPSAMTQLVSLPAGGRQRVSWWGTANDAPSADLLFSVTAQDGALQDASRPALGKLPILHYSAPQTYRTAGTLDEPGQRLVLVSLPHFVNPTAGPQGGGFQLEMAPSLAAALLQALDVLEHNDCPCNELTLSRLLANLETYRTFQQFDLGDPTQNEKLKRSIAEDLTTLLGRQSPDGGWGWWPTDDAFYRGESHSDPFLTSYILFGLTQAKEAGYLTDNQSIDRAVNYLNQNLAFDKLPNATGDLDRLAFAQFALTNAGSGSLDAIQALFKARARLSPWSQALLALALERLSAGSPQAQTLLSDLEASALRTAAGAHWELKDYQGTNMTDTLANSAIIAYTLAQRDPKSPLVADAARYLIANRQPDGAWSSTYATAWTLLALDEVMKATKELAGDFSFSASLNDLPVASGAVSPAPQLPSSPVSVNLPLSQLYPDAPNLLAIERGDGPGRLYYSAILDVSRPADQVEQLSQGLTLSRQYFPASLDCSKENCTPIQSAQPNEKVTVRLTLNVPNDAYYVRVEDYIPAGAEILDTRLKTSQQAQGGEPEATQQYDPADPYANGWGWWYFHEASLYDDHIAWAADYLPKGTYELTYTFVPLQAGEFQVLPAHAWEFYFPEVQATSAGDKFIIK